MGDDRYFAADRDTALERQRLETLASYYDPPTQEWLTNHTPLHAGDRVLEFGFGCGSMLAWFAKRVGASGDVLGIDRATGHTQNAAKPIRTRTGDIFAEPDEQQGFDLVYARLLLEHLADPARALTRMIDWAAPCGYIAVLDLDCTTVAAVDKSHPNADEFDRAAQGVCTALARSGLMDPAFGTQIKSLMAGAGLSDIRETRMERTDASGSPWARFQAANTRAVGTMVDAADAANHVADLLEQPGLTYHDQTLVAVVGRAPQR